jgi:DNA-binding transcriptional ArsR family regulator
VLPFTVLDSFFERKNMIISKQQMNDPCVYKVVKVYEVLYVGCGTSGMGRVFDISPEQKGRTKAFAQCDEVDVEYFSDKAAASSAEALLIHKLHPKHNAFCPKCGHYSKRRPKRLQGKGVVFGKTRHAILSLLLNNSEKAYFVREVARLTGVGVGATHRELKSLTKANILRRAQKGNSVFFQADTNSPFFHEMQSMVLKGA